MRLDLVLVVFTGMLLVGPPMALADDAGDAATSPDGAADSSTGYGDGAVDGGCDEVGADDAGICCGFCGSTTQVPLACDGGICDTTNGSACTIRGQTIGQSSDDSAWLALFVPASVLYLASRARRGARRPCCGGVGC